MRVLQVDSGRAWRGGQNQVRLLCRELLRQADVEQALVTKHGSELAQRAAAAGITVLGTAWDIGLDPRAWWHLRRTIRAFQPDIIHVHDSHSLALAASVASGRTMVATRRVEFRIGRFGSWRRAGRIIAISVAVNAAALTGEKDHGTLIRAAAHARGARPDLQWVVAGEGTLRESLADEIARRGLADRVHLIGHVDRVDALIAAASVFVLCSRREGLGSVILNALALNRPVVATAAGGVPEILPPESLVPVEAAEALAQKVVKMIEHPATIPLPPRFMAHAMAQGVLAVYRALL